MTCWDESIYCLYSLIFCFLFWWQITILPGYYFAVWCRINFGSNGNLQSLKWSTKTKKLSNIFKNQELVLCYTPTPCCCIKYETCSCRTHHQNSYHCHHCMPCPNWGLKKIGTKLRIDSTMNKWIIRTNLSITYTPWLFFWFDTK